MSIAERVQGLKDVASPSLEILVDASDADFQQYAKRWSDIDRKTPAAIVLPTTEEDIQNIVKWAVQQSIPFVTRSGGHSEWSTIGPEGFIIDLSRYKSLSIDKANQTATLRGGILIKELGVALSEQGLFAAVGNGNPVGVIPFMLNGGVPITISVTGYGSDQIVAARLVTAKGELVTVNASSHPDLLYALRGAGQFFGLVTELSSRVHPFSALGNDAGTIWAGTFVFPAVRAREVAETMRLIVEDGSYGTSGLMMIATPPPHFKQSVVIAARCTGAPGEGEKAYKALYDMKPIVAQGGELPIANASDGRAQVAEKGDLKRFNIAGLRKFDVDAFVKQAEIHNELLADCPDAQNTAFMFQWDARKAPDPGFDSANHLRDVRYFQNNLIWHTDSANRAKVDGHDKRCVEAMRASDPEGPIEYANATRVTPAEQRFRGKERMEKLRQLKKHWDPTGVFTGEFLD